MAMAERKARTEGAEVESLTLHKTVSRAGDRIQEIIDGAERLAVEIQTEAEAEAARYVEDRKRQVDELVDQRRRMFADLTEGFMARAESLESELSSALEALRETATWVEGLPRPEAPQPSAPIAEEAPSPAPERDAEPEEPLAAPPPAQDSPTGVPGEAVLRATQMAVSGSTQADIERALVSEFGIADPTPIVTEVLGRQFDSGPQLGTFTGPASAVPPARTD